jgi:flagellar motor switch protein FliM
MESILTKEEIEALVAAVNEGRLDPEKELARERGGVVNYDLFNSSSSKGLVPNLDIIYDSFIRYNRVTMSNRTRRIVDIRKAGSNAYKFDDFIMTLPSPVCIGIYKAEPLKGACMVAMDRNLVYATVDSVLGGTGSTRIPESNRQFTTIELRIMQKLVKDALLDMEKAWAPLCETKMSLLRMETNPRLVNIVPPEYQVITMELEIQVEGIHGSMVIAVPNMTINPIRDKLKMGAQIDMVAGDPKWSQRLSTELVEAPLDFAVELGEANITLRGLMELEPGDTILLDTDCRSELVAKVGDVGKYLCMPGMSRGNKAVRITRALSREVEL